MIDHAMLNPTALPNPAKGHNPLPRNEKAAKAFADQFGSALTTVAQADPKRQLAKKIARPQPSARAQYEPRQVADQAHLERREAPLANNRADRLINDARASQHQANPDTGGAKAASGNADRTPARKITPGQRAERAQNQPDHEAADTTPAEVPVDALKALLAQGTLSLDGTTTPGEPADTTSGTTDATSAMNLAQIGELLTQVTTQGNTDSPLNSTNSQAIPTMGEEGLDPTQAGLQSLGSTEESSAQIVDEQGVLDTQSLGASQGEPTQAAATPGNSRQESGLDALGNETAKAPTSTNPNLSQATTREQSASEAGTGTPALGQDDATSLNGQVQATAQASGSSTSPNAEGGQNQTSDSSVESTPSATTGANNQEAEHHQGDPNNGDPNAQLAQPQPTVRAEANSTTPGMMGIEGTAATTAPGTSPAQGAPMSQQAQSTANQATPTPGQALTPAQQLASAVGALRRRGDGSYLTEITMNPKELGQVRLQVHVAGTTVSMQANAQDPATRALLDAGLNDLRQALSDAGLESGHLDVSQGDSQDRQDDPQSPFASYGQHGVETIDEELLTLPTTLADYITSTSVNTLA